MNSPVKVNIVWSAEKIMQLESRTSYTTVAKFAEDAGVWPSEGWSIVLDFKKENVKPHSFITTARFLMPNAPWGRLKTGCVFEMYEGAKMTATVTVL